jgi:DeoR/GlpR family transcriptional regulator of sugar metabolism
MDAAQKLIVVADHSKWAVVGLGEIAPLSRIDILVTDDRLPTDAQQTVAETVGDLQLVPVEGARSI